MRKRVTLFPPVVVAGPGLVGMRGVAGTITQRLSRSSERSAALVASAAMRISWKGGW